MAIESLSAALMRLLLTLLALIAGLATPGMTLAAARAQVAEAAQVEAAGTVAKSDASIGMQASRTPEAAASAVDSIAPIVACRALAGCSIALSDRPLE